MCLSSWPSATTVRLPSRQYAESNPGCVWKPVLVSGGSSTSIITVSYLLPGTSKVSRAVRFTVASMMGSPPTPYALCVAGTKPMTLDSKGRKRPRDPNQLAKLIVDIASGEVEDRELTPEEQGKDPKAVSRGRAGGS